MNHVKTTRAVFVPFDLFGSSGTRTGVELLADGMREMLADNRREKIATRARSYTNKVRIEEFVFDTLEDYGTWRQQARTAVHDAWQRGEFLLWITGNHLGVLPVYEELGSQTGAVAVQFDAHLDIYNLSDCKEELSHGNFLLHADGPLPSIINVGHRELLLRPEYIAGHYRKTFPASDLAIDSTPALATLTEAGQSATRVLIDIDCDVFDPAYFAASAHPQPFGLSTQVFLRLLEAAWSPKVVGLALSEFDPARDTRDLGLSTLLWLIEYVLLKRHKDVKSR